MDTPSNSFSQGLLYNPAFSQKPCISCFHVARIFLVITFSRQRPKKTHSKSSGYRPDIDGLRALAVFAVFFFHAFPEVVRGGFIGVDVFFVISGFLISSIIFTQLENGSFSFWQFYSRRIRRIYPVLITVLVACLAFGALFLLSHGLFSVYFMLNGEYAQLGKHVAGGAGFISNILLWFESGYFDKTAEAKPLLHLWSLGIQEQFYIVWPLLLWLAWKKRFNFFAVSALFAVVSFGLNLYVYRIDPVADFFSPLTRFWELLTGAMLAWAFLHPGFFPVHMESGFFGDRFRLSACYANMKDSAISSP